GGLGADTLSGGSDDDLLLAGTTDQGSRAALDALMAEWTRTDATYAERVGHLRDGSAGGLNGMYRLDGRTVHDDAAFDRLSGNQDLDWFFARVSGPNADRVKDNRDGEVLIALL